VMVGIPERFAIEAEPREIAGEWIWGGFRFWLGDRQVGEWKDAAALQLCYGWLKRFCEHPLDCVEPRAAHSTSEQVFRLIVEPVMGPDAVADPAKQPVPFAYERFHISHLGMSSFDSYIVVLIKDTAGNERCLWRRHDDTTIYEQWLNPGEMERVACDFCQQFARINISTSPT